MQRIAVILPKGEGFSSQQFGAIALCVRDFTLASQYQSATIVIGGMSTQGFEAIDYAMPPPARWYENRTRAYAKGCIAIMRSRGVALAEIHNRPVLVRYIAGRTPAKLVLHLHNDPQGMKASRTPKERLQLLKRCAGIYCVSTYIRGRFLEGLPPEAGQKIFVIHNGIALPDTLPEKENVIVFAGRMTEDKGALLLAQALSIALPQLPRWRAVLIGSRRHEIGQNLTSYEKQIVETLESLVSQIELPGFLSHAETLVHFSRASIAVVPSLWQEPFGRTAIEAMAYGCALISSGRGALCEVTQDAALTLPSLNPDALANAIMALAHDGKQRLAYQALGRERAKYFAIETPTSELDSARDNILNSGVLHAA